MKCFVYVQVYVSALLSDPRLDPTIDTAIQMLLGRLKEGCSISNSVPARSTEPGCKQSISVSQRLKHWYNSSCTLLHHSFHKLKKL